MKKTWPSSFILGSVVVNKLVRHNFSQKFRLKKGTNDPESFFKRQMKRHSAKIWEKVNTFWTNLEQTTGPCYWDRHRPVLHQKEAVERNRS